MQRSSVEGASSRQEPGAEGRGSGERDEGQGPSVDRGPTAARPWAAVNAAARIIRNKRVIPTHETPEYNVSWRGAAPYFLYSSYNINYFSCRQCRQCSMSYQFVYVYL
jgi:hypothetical protein